MGGRVVVVVISRATEAVLGQALSSRCRSVVSRMGVAALERLLPWAVKKKGSLGLAPRVQAVGLVSASWPSRIANQTRRPLGNHDEHPLHASPRSIFTSLTPPTRVARYHKSPPRPWQREHSVATLDNPSPGILQGHASTRTHP